MYVRMYVKSLSECGCMYLSVSTYVGMSVYKVCVSVCEYVCICQRMSHCSFTCVGVGVPKSVSACETISGERHPCIV